MSQKIPLFKIYWDSQDIKAVTRVIKSGSYWATGLEIKKFEEKIARFVGTKYAVVFNSGTSALHATLLAAGVGSDDEVIVPSFAFIATANVALFVGAQPVFAEIEDQTFGLDPKDVEEKITSKTKAIIPIQFAGCPCLYIGQLKKIAKKHHLFLVEDAAQSLGARIGNKMVGTFGDAAIFSFCQDKIISCGEGGVAVTNSKEIYEGLKLIRSHGRAETPDYFSPSEYLDYITLGYGFRLPTMAAALGLSQLSKINKIIRLRRKKAYSYHSHLAEITNLKLPLSPKNFLHVYQKYTIQVEPKLRDGLQKHLTNKGISTKTYFAPVHLTKFYQEELGCREGNLPATEEISKKVLNLPLSPTLKEKEIDKITKAIREFMRKHE